ncbi:MAG: Lin0512 family protein, partial [Desulfobacterales bacterium]
MTRKRYIVELGSGADLHGGDVTKAACRAVKDAVSRSCLCGVLEILGRREFEGIHVDVLLACPQPEAVDAQAVKDQIPIGTKSVRAVAGGLEAPGICVDAFARDCDTIVVANA